MTRPRPWQVFGGLLLIIVLTQLLTSWLGSRRPAEPPTLFAGVAALADPRAPTLGPASANVLIYVVSDYACGNCRALHPALRTLVAEDPDVRLVYRDWPTLGARSTRAARLALASAAQGRHAAFDDALMRRGGSLDETALRAAAAAAGVDWQRLERDAASPAVTRLLDDTDRLARGLGLAGTPVLVVGPYLVTGRVPLERLRELVRDARAP
ncbi:DsbA family protein [Glacieibacterium frigidum]|uniref:DsbA family protein n=1 Tax=Glacieibacterium frigidum TaxID=2593303 RepID=UPI00163DB032|nr:DsbA family protein [Glacieibacterium frigidum]